MRAPVLLYADEALIRGMDDKVSEQASNVATLPGIVGAVHVMPDAHGATARSAASRPSMPRRAASSPPAGGLRHLLRCPQHDDRIAAAELEPVRHAVADSLARIIPAGVGREGGSRSMRGRWTRCWRRRGLGGGTRLGRGGGSSAHRGRRPHGGARPYCVSGRAKERQRHEMGTLGSGNHYLELQVVEESSTRPRRPPSGWWLARSSSPSIAARAASATRSAPSSSRGWWWRGRRRACICPTATRLRAHPFGGGPALPRRDARRDQLRPRQPRDPRP